MQFRIGRKEQLGAQLRTQQAEEHERERWGWCSSPMAKSQEEAQRQEQEQEGREAEEKPPALVRKPVLLPTRFSISSQWEQYTKDSNQTQKDERQINVHWIPSREYKTVQSQPFQSGDLPAVSAGLSCRIVILESELEIPEV